ncbi:pentapeptide repeat-containing protein [Mesoflavibacter zeaxanthinifaciens]|uniref:pentapeptide repeat-containing protein n=1 Tax=Mesoflavibacter zeaxanthinifaciens TaxID=393060 RepID=UPI003A9214F6
MARTLITQAEFDAQFNLAEGFGNSHPIRFNSKIFDFYVEISPGHRELIFYDCLFTEKVLFTWGPELVQVLEDNVEPANIFGNNITNIFKETVFFNSCIFEDFIQFDNLIFNGKFRMHNCVLQNVSFRNTTFNDLADFWATTFTEKTIFYKTDFNKTSVFSMATFNDNVLFTYALFGSKAIFARTKFKKGIDISQTIISGSLQLFDLHFNFKKYDAIYVGTDDKTYQNFIDRDAIIPLENKVHTFQVLKKAFEDIGNYSDSILMLREEKRALKKLVYHKLEDKNPDSNKGDKWILILNRISNHYQSDFRNGIWFTLGVTVVFGLLTLVFTRAYLDNICFSDCEFNPNRLLNGIKFFINFLNPARKLDYLDNLKPTFGGISYIFDFLGRIAVGYGFYQTVQAFRKYK